MSPIGPLRALIVPRCVACRTGHAPQRLLCSACWEAMPWLVAPLCRACGLPRPCGVPCPASAWAFTSAWAPLDYGGPVVSLVRALKERGAHPAAELMAATIVARAPPGLLTAGVSLVPVPADPWRRRVRGIDHAQVLAMAIARRTGGPVAAVLHRTAGGRQARRDRAARIEARLTVQTDAVSVVRSVVLVDDVHTTGATLHSAASALRAAGAEHMHCLTFARSI